MAININNLLKYYIECLEIESLEEMSFPSFKMDEVFTRFPGSSEWSSENNPTKNFSLPHRMRSSLSLSGGTSNLFYGWPIYARPSIAKNGNPYCWIEPVFLLKVEFHSSGPTTESTLLKEWPKINDRILKSYIQTIDERVQLSELLGLSNADSLDSEGLISYWTKLVGLFPNFKIVEPIQSTKLSSENFSNLPKEGFYNHALLLTSSAPRWNRGLLRELRKLNEPTIISQIPITSLASLLSMEAQQKLKPSNQTEKLQISPLNRSQRQASTRAFENKLTVITGPPGTGKSQVVLNILANAFENNQTVLFTSKNNKAVDVVCERVLDSLDFPINLRLGPKTTERDYTIEFLDLLDKFLAGGNKESIETNYNLAKQDYARSKTTYFESLASLEKIVSLRNQIDELDKTYEHYENSIDPTVFQKVLDLPFTQSKKLFSAENALKALQTKRIPFGSKIIGLFSKRYPFKPLHSHCIEVNSIIANIFTLPDVVIYSLSTYSTFLAQAHTVLDFKALQYKINNLRVQLSSLDINSTSEKIDVQEKDFVEKCRRYIECLGKHRMINLTDQQRNDLTNYHSVVRQLIGEFPGNTAFARLKEQQEVLFQRILNLLPVWSVTNLATSGHFPFSPGIFDLVIIDEASQSDIASSIPLLYRAKQAVIIGDPHQLKNISSISRPEDNQYLEKYDLLGNDTLRFSYSAQSLYHCSRGAVGQESVTLLNEHYRSHFSIIEFSNREWYDGNLEIRTNYSNLFFPPDGREHIEWINVVGQTRRPQNTSGLNIVEANKVVEVLDQLFNIYTDPKPSIGIVTPFVAQKEYIIQVLSDKYGEDLRRSHFLLVNSAHQFQGDERDIVIFSPVVSRGVASQTIDFLRRTYNLFNVSITRARSILWVVGDKQACIGAGIPFLKNFVEYIGNKGYTNLDIPHSRFESPYEKNLFEILKTMGYDPQIQHSAGPYRIDLALLVDGKKLAIEVDGARWHTTLTGDRLERDIVRDRNLRRMGWDVLRFWVHDLKYNLGECIKIIENHV